MADGRSRIAELGGNPQEVHDAAPPLGDDISPIASLSQEEWDTLKACVALDENDAGNGQRLLRWFGRDLLFVQESGWYWWRETHWDGESGQYAAERCAQDIVPMIKREAALISANPDQVEALEHAARLKKEFPDPQKRSGEVKERIKEAEVIGKLLARKRQGRFQFAIKSGDRSRTSAMISQAAPHRAILPRTLDADDLALNTLSGTLKFRRKIDPECPDPDLVRYRVKIEVVPHQREDHITKVTEARYDPAATATRWLADLERFMPNGENREFLQVFMGYCALGFTGEQVYAFFYGDGQNWKSAFLQSIGRTLGTYTKPMNYASVSGQNSPSGDRASPDWARLPGVRLLTIEEVPRREPIKEELLKLITSGSDMPVRHLNKGLFDMVPKFTAVMTSNAEPNIAGADTGIWRRTLIVPWEIKVPDEERLPFDQVMAIYDQEREGILRWIVDGACKYLESGLGPFITDEMRAFANSVRRDRDAVGAFAEDCIEHSTGSHVTSRELYQAFTRWCGANGVAPVPSETSFGNKLKRVPINGEVMEKRKRNVHGVKRFADVRLHDVPHTEASTFDP